MNHAAQRHLYCGECRSEFSVDSVRYNCPDCSGNLDLQLDFASADPDLIRASNDWSLWRYTPLLPAGPPAGPRTPLHSAGWTPIFAPPSLSADLGGCSVLVKDEGRNPTASFKDRASALVVAHALRSEVATIVTASSGNAGAALAGMAAAVGLQAVILVPKHAPPAKIAQLLVFGARVFLVDGTYDDAFDLSLAAADAFGWYCRNTGYNPYTIEGKKTAAFEIWEQAGRWLQDPDRPLHLFVSVGDGNIISGLHKGFKELHTLGWIRALPRIFGVQAEGAAAIAHAFEAGTESIRAVEAKTMADSISVGLPRDGLRALRAVTETGGAYVTVADDEILAAILDLGHIGVFAEPAAAAAYAGLKKAAAGSLLSPDSPVLVLSTGNGLKDVAAANRAAGTAPIIDPDLEALRRALR